MTTKAPIETHPLSPFLPEGARILMLGSFPPKRERWSMEFFYPNWINDMWRIFGLIFFGDKDHFVGDAKRFNRDRCAAFAAERGIAMFDTATQVRRLKDNVNAPRLPKTRCSACSRMAQVFITTTSAPSASCTMA